LKGSRGNDVVTPRAQPCLLLADCVCVAGPKCIFGVLTQLQEGKWSIEDLNNAVAVDISEAEMTSGLFTDNCLVMAQGATIFLSRCCCWCSC
jgi:hypothetical protein